MNLPDREIIDQALRLLADILESTGAPAFQLVVRGGSSQIAMELVSRTTRDVDVLAFLSPQGQIQEARPFPTEISEASRRVASTLGLDDNWLNPGPADLVSSGLPDGLGQRLIAKKYGEHLTVHFISRIDQIFFKVYAAADDASGRHSDDLLALVPSPEEIAAAAQWALAQDPSFGFQQILKDMLGKLGYESVAERL